MSDNTLFKLEMQTAYLTATFPSLPRGKLIRYNTNSNIISNPKVPLKKEKYEKVIESKIVLIGHPIGYLFAYSTVNK